MPFAHLLHVFSAILQGLFWWTPWTTEDHSIQCALVEGDIDATGFNIFHVSDVAHLECDASFSFVTRFHQIHHNSRKVEA